MNHAHQVHAYRPQRTRPESLEAIFVAREPLVNEMLARLGQWGPGKSRQHYLLIGPRGIGKTCMLQILQHRVRKAALAERWETIAISEEGYRLRSVADLLLQALEILGEAIDDPDIRGTYADVRYDADDRRVVDLALDAFRRFHARTGKGIVLMVENVNRVFDEQMNRHDQTHLLRKILIEEDWLVMIATSPTYVNAVSDPDEPLFEFFQVKPLAELTLDEQVSMLRKLAALEANETFQEYLREFRPRLQALYHFTGGNPRLAIMLYDLIAHQQITDVQAELDALLDKLTPFYQDRMRELAGQEAQLLEQMALLPEGCTPNELAREARMPAKIVRALLTRLEDSGYVRREQRRMKQTVYIIPERFFRIWHQLNHSRAARGRLQYLLEFFSTWYASREERDEVWQELTDLHGEGVAQADEQRVEDVAEYMHYIAAVCEGKERYEREFEALRMEVLHKGAEAADTRLPELDREHSKDPSYHLEKGRFLAEVLDDHEAALAAFDEACRLEPRDPIALYNRAVALDRLGFAAESVKVYEQAAICLSKQREPYYSEETEKLLLETLRTVGVQGLVQAAAGLLGRFGNKSIVPEVISIAGVSPEAWRRRCCCNMLEKLGGEQAVHGLFALLQDEDAEVRGSAATALGRIGSGEAVGPLIACLGDPANDVRVSAAGALGRIGSDEAVEPLFGLLDDRDSRTRGVAAWAFWHIVLVQSISRPAGGLLDTVWMRLSPKQGPRSYVAGRLLRSAFDSGNLELTRTVVETTVRDIENGQEIFKPYLVALEYIDSERDPGVLERQHPEMREAVKLLIDLFDKGGYGD